LQSGTPRILASSPAPLLLPAAAALLVALVVGAGLLAGWDWAAGTAALGRVLWSLADAGQSGLGGPVAGGGLSSGPPAMCGPGMPPPPPRPPDDGPSISAAPGAGDAGEGAGVDGRTYDQTTHGERVMARTADWVQGADSRAGGVVRGLVSPVPLVYGAFAFHLENFVRSPIPYVPPIEQPDIGPGDDC